MATPRDAIADRICERLSELAAQHGMTKEALGVATGYHPVDIGRVLNRRAKYPPMTMLDALARVFGVTLADLVAGTVPKHEWKPEIRDAAIALQGIAPGDRGALLRMIVAMSRGRAPKRE